MHFLGPLACAWHAAPRHRPKPWRGSEKEALQSCSEFPGFQRCFLPCREGAGLPPLPQPQRPSLIHFAIPARCAPGPRNAHVMVAPVSCGFWNLPASPNRHGTSARVSRPVSCLLTRERLRESYHEAVALVACSEAPASGWLMSWSSDASAGPDAHSPTPHPPARVARTCQHPGHVAACWELGHEEICFLASHFYVKRRM